MHRGVWKCIIHGGVESSWNMMAHVDAREGKWRGNWRMEWVASTLHTTSEHGVSSITTADAHTWAASSRLNWRPRRFKWTRPFRRKTKSGFCACAITFQLASTHCIGGWVGPRTSLDRCGKSRIMLTTLTAIRASFLVTRTTRHPGWCIRASWLSAERRIAFNFSCRCVSYVSKIGHIMWQILFSVMSCRRRKLPLSTNVFSLFTKTFVLPFPVAEHCA